MLRSLGPAMVFAAILPWTSAQSAPAGSAGDASAPDAAVQQEFSELDVLMEQMSQVFGSSRKFCAPDPGSVLAARLAVFPRRFGFDPRAAPPWKALQEHAGRVLAGVGERGHVETGEIQDVSGQMDRYVLLDILGRSEEAEQILSCVSTTGADGCIWCTAENSVVANQRRSEDAERRGDVGAALRFLHDSVLDIGVISDPGYGRLPGEDLLLARYGLLLEQTGHQDLGLLVLQDLVRTRPDSIGGRMARAELEQRNAGDGVDRARFLSCELTGGTACRSCAIVAVWNAGDPDSVRWIAARLPQRSDSECTRTVAFEAVAYEEARPALEAAIARGSLDALILSSALPGGAEPEVDAYLDGVGRIEDRRSAPLLSTDQTLRWLHGSGPRHAIPLGRCDWHAFAEDWKAWRKQTGTRVRSAH